jgi:hypothetical protein
MESCWFFFVVLILGPLVPEEFIPRQDMKFDDLDEAYDYYCDYAKNDRI